MTENEAIKVLVTQKQCIDKSSSGQCKINCGDCKKNIPIAYQEKSYEVAITALKEIQLYKDGKLCLVPKDVYSKQCCELDAYKKIGTVEECREAVEKQKAKKCIIDSCPDHTHYKCPSCGKIHLSRYKHGFPSLGRIPRFCDHCGQAIAENWREWKNDIYHTVQRRRNSND